MSLSAADVVAQFGAYYIPGGQSIANVKKALYAKSKTAMLFMDRPMEGNYFRSTQANLNSVLQSFQKAFTPLGDLTFEPNAFPLFNNKIDLSIYPDDIKSSYLGFFAGLPEEDRAAWPIVRYMIEVHCIPAKDRDIELQAIFGGSYVAPTANVAGSPATAMDGIKKVLKRYNTAGRLNVGAGTLSMGALATTPVDFCTQVEEWVASMNPVLRDEITEIIMSEQLSLRYRAGKRLKYGGSFNYITDASSNGLQTIEAFPQIMVKGFISHNGSDIIWATPNVNRIRPIWKTPLTSVFKIESVKREVSIFTDWWEAYDFEVPEFVVVNDAADLA